MLECLSCSWIVIVVDVKDDEGLLLLLSVLLSVAERQSLMIFSCSLESVLVVVMVSGCGEIGRYCVGSAMMP